MKIECAKSTKYLGVRGRGEGSWLFCPHRRNTKYRAGIKVLLKDCTKCPFYQGEHETCEVNLVWIKPSGKEEKIGK